VAKNSECGDEKKINNINVNFKMPPRRGGEEGAWRN
jgi:hypothetical protein